MFQRAEQASVVATARQRAELAGHEARLIAERNRLGRDLHDVLAHTLGGLSIQLTALEAQLRAGADRHQLVREVERSQQLVSEGIEEARQAVRALREEPAPLVEQIGRLARLHAAGLRVEGTPRPTGPEATAALYRAVQEALTNAAKHAPGADVDV